MAKKGFSLQEKREHYTAVASGKKPVKKDSGFTRKEQISYAKGQRDARNEELRVYAYKQATPAARAKFEKQKRARAEKYKQTRTKGGNK